MRKSSQSIVDKTEKVVVDIANTDPENINIRDVIGFEVNIYIDRFDHIALGYRSTFLGKLGNGETIEEYIKALNKDVYTSDWSDPNLTHSMTNSMSIQDKTDCYVVLMLNRVRNWEFTKGSTPVKVEISKSDYFHKLNIVDDAGVVTPVNSNADMQAGINLCYFTAENKRHYDDHGDGARIGFNLNVDIIGKANNAEPARIPIIIDPDIGHPGGSFP